jgi:hypothetical protein
MISDVRRLSQAAMEVTAQEEEDMGEVAVEDVEAVEGLVAGVAEAMEEEEDVEDVEEDVGVVEVDEEGIWSYDLQFC